MKGRYNPSQLTMDKLFEVPAAPKLTPGSLQFNNELRNVLSAILKQSPKSRYEIAARMSELLDEEISKNMIDSWTAESRRGWRFPFEFTAAFETACESYQLTELLAQKRGCKILVGEEVLLAELGKLESMEADLKERKKALKQIMKRR